MTQRVLAWFAAFAVVGLTLACVATGLEVVAPGEALVVRRLGRALPEARLAGPYFGWPLGLERRDRIRTDVVRQLEVGLAGVAGPDDDPAAGEFLTGDGNLIRLRAVVQYRVADPVAYALNSQDVDRLLTRLAESSLARSLTRSPIDEALQAGGSTVAFAAEDELREVSSRLGLGVQILGIRSSDARPPAEVQPDFDAAQAARSQADRRRNEALARGSATLSAAHAEAQALRDAAAADAERAVALAHARASRFLDLLAETHRDRRLSVHRLYRDAIRDLLPKVGRKLVAPGDTVDLGVLGIDP